MDIDCVFSGGGVKAFAFVGALEGVQKKGLTIKRVAGTSAGAIIAALLAANYRTHEIKTLMGEIHLKHLLDPPYLGKLPFVKWFLFYFQKGLYKGDQMEKWLTSVLSKQGLHTFRDVPRGHLKVIVSDISLGKLIVIPDDLQRVYGINPDTFKVATAVRMSASFPFFYMPKKLITQSASESYIVDGGLLSNFPLWIFRHKETQDARPVLGISLSEDVENAKSYPIKNALDMLQAVFHTMQRAHDNRYIAKSKEKNIIFIPVKQVGTMDMMITDHEKQVLYQLGMEKADHFLQTWPK
jgi:NTE family protein